MVSRVYHSLLDNIELLFGKRDRSAPPRRLARQSFAGLGPEAEESVRRLVELTELKPDGLVLEVGCGCGSAARILARRLGRQGGYWGFDVDRESVAWCRRNVELNHPNFHFQVADVFHASLQPRGRFKPSAYRFPFLDDYFDVVLITTTFTRMEASEMVNFLGQAGRVLKPGGRCVISYLLLNDASRRLLDSEFAEGNWQVMESKESSATVGYDEQFVREHCAANTLRVLEPIHYGGWCGRRGASQHPDIVVAAKIPASVAAAGRDSARPHAKAEC